MFDRAKRTKIDTYGLTGLIDETTAYLQHKHDLLNELADHIIDGHTYSIRFDNRVTTYPMSSEKVCDTRLKADIIPECLSINMRKTRQTYLPWPSHVIFHPPATVVFWDDDTKTVVKCMKDEEFNPEIGLAMCFCKKVMGDGYKRWFKDAREKGGWEDG